MTDRMVSTSRFLSRVLRHEPEAIGLTLDAAGWADLDRLIDLAHAHGVELTREHVIAVVAGSDKQRFAIADDGIRIRANQGHSVAVDLGLTARAPPDALYHGTATRFADSIRAQGLVPGARQHVHLSATRSTAAQVGARHGVPLVLTLRAADMHRSDHAFYVSANGVWLTAHVPPGYLEFFATD